MAKLLRRETIGLQWIDIDRFCEDSALIELHEGNRPDACDFSSERKAVLISITIQTHRVIFSIQ